MNQTASSEERAYPVEDKTMESSKKRKKGSRAVSKLVLLAGAALLTGAAMADEKDVCITAGGGLTGFPNIDGVIVADATHPRDNGWNLSTLLGLNTNSGVDREAQLFLTREGTSFIYLGLVVDDPTPAIDDTVLITLSSNMPDEDTDCANDWRIQIKPYDSTGALPADGKPFIAEYTRNSCISTTNPNGAWNGAGATPVNPDRATHWLYVNSGVTRDGSRWQLELKIPRVDAPSAADTSVGLPASGEFSLYVNVLSTNNILATVTQAEWPEGSTITGPGNLNQLTPKKMNGATEIWGTASLNTRAECSGLSLAWNQIGTKNTLSGSEMKLGTPPYTCPPTSTTPDGPLNEFFALPSNDMGADAADVTATFSLANWGLPSPSSWGPIPPGGSGTTAAQVVHSPSTAADEFVRTWSLTPQQICDYNAHRHQCMKVDLDSTSSAVRFKNRGAQRNMDFVTTSSPFKRDAEISAKGYGQAAGSNANTRDFMLTIATEVQHYSRDGEFYYPKREREDKEPLLNDAIPAKQFPKGLNEAFGWVARGYLLTGNKIRIDRTDYEVAEGVGGFGYLVGHDGPVSGWTPKLEGKSVKEAGKDGNLYVVQVPVDGVVTVTTTVTPDVGGGNNGTECKGLACIPWWVWILIIIIIIIIIVIIRRRSSP